MGEATAAPGRRARHEHRRGPWPRRLALVTLFTVVVAVAAVAWLAWRGLQARDALLEAQPLTGRVQDQVTAGDVEAARATLSELQDRTATARNSTHDPVWALAARLPQVGDDVRAVRTVTAAVDDVALEVLAPLVEAAASLDPASLAPVDGAVDLAPLEAAAPAVQRADAAMRVARADVAAVDLSGVDARVAEPVRQLRTQLDRAAGTTATGARAAALLPPMLGADGPRTYLVLFQNNAEARATGGVAGALAVLRADDGRIEVVEQLAAGDIGRFPEPVLPISAEMQGLHTDLMASNITAVNLTPHFPTTAQLAREMYRRVSGTEVDGVLSVDPVALSYLMEATGPIAVPGGQQLTADNAVDVLISQVYADIEEPGLQDAFFAGAAASVLGTLTSGVDDPVGLVQQLARAAGERRLLVWSATETEQARLAGTVLEGSLPDEDVDGPLFGVYLVDGAGSKMSYYLRQSVAVAGTCRDDGLSGYDVTVDLTSTAPADAAGSLPDYVLGGGRVGAEEVGVAPGDVRTYVLVYGPTGAGVVEMRQDGEQVPFVTHAERNRPVGRVTVDLAPGESTSLSARVVTDAEPGVPLLRTTPGVTPPDFRTTSSPCT